MTRIPFRGCACDQVVRWAVRSFHIRSGIENVWLSYYPPEGLDKEKRDVLMLLEKTMPGMATFILQKTGARLSVSSRRDTATTTSSIRLSLSSHARSGLIA